MKIQIQYSGRFFLADLSMPLDISIPLVPDSEQQVNCFYAPFFEAEPVRAGEFIGSVKEGGPVNFLNVRLNPHGNGTHTECIGHISATPYALPDSLQQTHFLAKLISVYPQRKNNGDRVITRSQLESLYQAEEGIRSIIIRTLPNDDSKCRRFYSGQNPPYVDPEAIVFLVESGIDHLFIDLPSIDKEEDGGRLSAHRAFWHYPEQPRNFATITELVYVPETIQDGLFLVNLQITAMRIDVSPSRPILFNLHPIDE